MNAEISGRFRQWSDHGSLPFLTPGSTGRAGKSAGNYLNWYKRLEIAVHVARGLEYLHSSAVSSQNSSALLTAICFRLQSIQLDINSFRITRDLEEIRGS